MTRNPQDSPEENAQNNVLQPFHDALGSEKPELIGPRRHDAPVFQTEPERALDTKVELDRLEAYLKGPTVFTA